MPFGDILSSIKGKITLISADGKKTTIDSLLKKLGLRFVGIPHTEMRTRARIIRERLALKSGMKVFDAGCGNGFYALSIAKAARGKNIFATGVDIERDKIANANRIAHDAQIKNSHFEYGDLRNLRFKNETFDRIICSDVLEHIEEDVDVLGELSRVMKRDGRAIFTFPSVNPHNTETMDEFGHVRPGYTYKDFKMKAEKNGLRIVESTGYTYLFGKIAWGLNNFMMKVPPIAALTFYPVYWISLLDFLKIGTPNGLLFVVVKEK